MATIFRAVHEQTGRAVAIKLPLPGAERHFRREFEILRRLNHPGVVRVLDGTGCGRLAMVMEWAEGRSLRQILSNTGTLAPEAAVRIALALSPTFTAAALCTAI